MDHNNWSLLLYISGIKNYNNIRNMKFKGQTRMIVMAVILFYFIANGRIASFQQPALYSAHAGRLH